MRYKFGASSLDKLSTCHTDLQRVAIKVMRWQVYDFTIVWGFRNEPQQNQAFLEGNSTKRWPESLHNVMDNDRPTALALDFAPWCLLPDGTMGIPWKDTHAFAVLGGMFIAAGQELGIPIEYGGDWDMDGLTTDQRLMDWGHVQLRR